MVRKVMPSGSRGNSLDQATLQCSDGIDSVEVPEKPEAGRPRRGRRTPAPLSPERLRSAALWYLERFSGSRTTVKRFLDRRIRRGEMAGDPAAAEATDWVAPLLDELERIGLVDDVRVAESLARIKLDRGESQRRILARLASKGIDGDKARSALEAALAERGDLQPERASALRMAARKRLGPYRPIDQREQYRDRDLRTLARQGYGAAIAYWIVDAESLEALEDEGA